MEATIKKARLGERQRRKPDFENYQEYSHLVELSEAGGIPAIWTGTTNVRWMKELTKITLGYHNFYGKGEKVVVLFSRMMIENEK